VIHSHKPTIGSESAIRSGIADEVNQEGRYSSKKRNTNADGMCCGVSSMPTSPVRVASTFDATEIVYPTGGAAASDS